MTLIADRPAPAPAPEVASDQLVVDVIQGDIDGAARGPYLCPIARALRRLGYAHVTVGIGTASIGRRERREYRLDSNGRGLIEAFDLGNRVKPTRVTLTPL